MRVVIRECCLAKTGSFAANEVVLGALAHYGVETEPVSRPSAELIRMMPRGSNTSPIFRHRSNTARL